MRYASHRKCSPRVHTRLNLGQLKGSPAANDVVSAGDARVGLEDNDDKVEANDEADQHLL